MSNPANATAASPNPMQALPIPSGFTQTDEAYSSLRSAIVKCEFEPGERLRVEELSHRFDVSSSPLREALNRLVEQGLVNAFENRGFRVAPLTVEGITDLTRMRLLIEVEALRDSMAHGDDRWEVALVAAAHALSLSEQRLASVAPVLDDNWSARHREFHMATYAACSSPLMAGLVVQLFDRAERYRRYSARFRKAPRHKSTEHQRLLNAILSRDQDKAAELLRQHISATERNVTAALLSANKTLQ